MLGVSSISDEDGVRCPLVLLDDKNEKLRREIVSCGKSLMMVNYQARQDSISDKTKDVVIFQRCFLLRNTGLVLARVKTYIF